MKFYFLTIYTFVFLFFWGCKKVEKDVNNYYPKVTTVSAAVNPDGTVTVTGHIVSEGSTAVSACGFCMDTLKYPDMLSNQLISSTRNGNDFTCTYSSLSTVDTYYFRAWVVNGNGYALGSPVSITNVCFDTSLIPCHPVAGHLVLSSNYLISDEIYIDFSNVPINALTYGVTGTTNTHTISLSFGNRPVSGIYKTTTANDPGGWNVILLLDWVRVDAPANVYVQQINSTTMDITICQATVSRYNYDITTKFRCHY